jgi:centrosomal CEP192-like protein
VSISQANVSGSGFSISGLNLPITLTPGQSYTFSTVFAPTSAGTMSGSIVIVSDASNSSLTIALSGRLLPPGSCCYRRRRWTSAPSLWARTRVSRLR